MSNSLDLDKCTVSFIPLCRIVLAISRTPPLLPSDQTRHPLICSLWLGFAFSQKVVQTCPLQTGLSPKETVSRDLSMSSLALLSAVPGRRRPTCIHSPAGGQLGPLLLSGTVSIQVRALVCSSVVTAVGDAPGRAVAGSHGEPVLLPEKRQLPLKVAVPSRLHTTNQRESLWVPVLSGSLYCLGWDLKTSSRYLGPLPGTLPPSACGDPGTVKAPWHVRWLCLLVLGDEVLWGYLLFLDQAPTCPPPSLG